MKVERSEVSNRERFQKRKLSRGASSSLGKRARESQTESVHSSTIRGRRQRNTIVPSTGRGASVGQGDAPECPHCHRRHLGVCRLLTGGCFRCGSTYHFMVNCLRESKNNRSMQGSGRGRSVAPHSTRDRGRGRGGPSQHRGHGGTVLETVDHRMLTAPTRVLTDFLYRPNLPSN